ncbi:MAG: hypothetical protein Q8R39_02295 [bacterium]|nr:hypothetical protein [bacterium]
MSVERRGKPMFRVEKFLPNECPKCRHHFLKEGEDYVRLFGDIIDGRKILRETTGYDIIICDKCKNCTARVMIEAYHVSDRTKAEALFREGFINLQPVESFGSHIEDAHEIFTEIPGLRVRSLKL